MCALPISGRQVRWHKKEDHFCLPYETREIVVEENKEDEGLKVEVSEIFERRATEFLNSIENPRIIPEVVALCHRALEITFEKQGLEVACFLSGDEPERPIQSTIHDNKIGRASCRESVCQYV